MSNVAIFFKDKEAAIFVKKILQNKLRRNKLTEYKITDIRTDGNTLIVPKEVLQDAISEANIIKAKYELLE